MKRLSILGFCGVAAMAASSFAADPPATSPSGTPTTKVTAPANTAPVAKQPTPVTPTTPVTHTPATTPATAATPAPVKVLYERLGGEKAIAAVVSDFVDRAEKDTHVNFTRHGTAKEWKATPENVTALKHHVTQYMCMATGGPQKYDGAALKTVSQGMEITTAEFDALTADFSAALDHAKVVKADHDDMMKIVAGTKDQIVEQSAKTSMVKPTSATTPAGSKK